MALCVSVWVWFLQERGEILLNKKMFYLESFTRDSLELICFIYSTWVINKFASKNGQDLLMNAQCSRSIILDKRAICKCFIRTNLSRKEIILLHFSEMWLLRGSRMFFPLCCSYRLCFISFYFIIFEWVCNAKYIIYIQQATQPEVSCKEHKWSEDMINNNQ